MPVGTLDILALVLVLNRGLEVAAAVIGTEGALVSLRTAEVDEGMRDAAVEEDSGWSGARKKPP